jgi:acyl carrier protein
MSDLEEQLASILVTQFEVEAGSITPATRFQEDLKADSLEVVELIMTVEEIFDIVVDDDVAEKLQTVGDLIDFLKSKQPA